MRNIGNFSLTLIALLCTLFSGTAAAALNASLDRAQIAMGDTVRLTLAADNGEDINSVDLSALTADFDILQTSSSSNVSITNGRRTQLKKIQVDLSPKREGPGVIPSLRVGRKSSAPIAYRVLPAPDMASGVVQDVFLEADVDSNSVYVQSQVLLTVRLYQSIQLENAGISPLEIEDAFVKPLEQQSFQRTLEGKRFRVTQLRFAIFPEKSGTLDIPSQVFTARVRTGNGGLFNRGLGKQLQRRTQPLSIEVKPRPTNFNGAQWLPATRLTVQERWSTPPEQLRVGESATRTVTLVGEGVQGAQLPPVRIPPTDRLKVYPDQPEISERENDEGLVGQRKDTTAIVPVKAGQWQLPEISIPWWDTQAQRLRYATLPAKTLIVSPGEAIAPTPPQPQAAPEHAEPANTTTVIDSRSAHRWQLIAAITTALWLLTLAAAALWWHYQKRSVSAKKTAINAERPGARNALKRLRQACENNKAQEARHRLIEWAAAASGREEIKTLDQLVAHFNDDALGEAVNVLEQSLYGAQSRPWDGAKLWQICQQLASARPATSKDAALRLYPQT